MRGDEQQQAGFIVMTTLEDVVPDDHPLRTIRSLVDLALVEMKPALDALYQAAEILAASLLGRGSAASVCLPQTACL